MAAVPRRESKWGIASLAERNLRFAANNYSVQQELKSFQDAWFEIMRDNFDSFSVAATTRSKGLDVELLPAESVPATQVEQDREQDQGLLKQVGLRTLTLAMAFVCERGFPQGNTHVMGCTNYRSTEIPICNAHVKKKSFCNVLLFHVDGKERENKGKFYDHLLFGAWLDEEGMDKLF